MVHETRRYSLQAQRLSILLTTYTINCVFRLEPNLDAQDLCNQRLDE